MELTEENYPRYRPHPFKYRKRVESLCKLIPLNRCMIVLKSFPVKYMSNDIDYLYRQNTDIIYLCGFPEPESALVIIKDCNVITSKLYVREKCPEEEIWTGKYFGTEGAKEFFNIDSSRDIKTLNKDIDNYDGIVYNHSDVILHIQQLRLVKDKDEIDLMRKSCLIAGNAHVKTIQHASKIFRQVGAVSEIELDAMLTYEITRAGCRRLAYPNVVAAGTNATCLHYNSYDDIARDGDLVLVDAGGEYKYYASDITRTWPVNGKFTKPQAAIYNIVLKANKECIEMAKPNLTLRIIHNHAKKVIKEGLIELGFIDDLGTLKGSLNMDEWANGEVTDFFMHNVGHWIGIDVHDCRETDRWNVILKPGHCFTIEPGIYIKPYSEIPSEYHGIGIRIEDDIVITSDGCEVLSKSVPKELEDIEKLFEV